MNRLWPICTNAGGHRQAGCELHTRTAALCRTMCAMHPPLLLQSRDGERAQRTSCTMACCSCQLSPPIQARQPREKSHPRTAKPASGSGRAQRAQCCRVRSARVAPSARFRTVGVGRSYLEGKAVHATSAAGACLTHKVTAACRRQVHAKRVGGQVDFPLLGQDLQVTQWRWTDGWVRVAGCSIGCRAAFKNPHEGTHAQQFQSGSRRLADEGAHPVGFVCPCHEVTERTATDVPVGVGAPARTGGSRE